MINLMFIYSKVETNFISLVANDVGMVFGFLHKIDKIYVFDGESANLDAR